MGNGTEKTKAKIGEFPNEKKFFKIWRANADAKACFLVTPRIAMMVGSKENFIGVSSAGTVIMGNTIVLGALSEQIRKGGFFVGMNDFIQCIPSTIVTPGTNMSIPMPPIGFPIAIASELPLFIAALG